MIEKIITHGGIFHCDEVLAVALLISKFGDIPIVRKYANEISEEEFNNPNILILDVGRRYEPNLGNFDHHQDANLMATCGLILFQYYEKPIADIMWEQFIELCSGVDVGIHTGSSVNGTIPHMISGFNRNPNDNHPDSTREYFNNALNFMMTIVENYLSKCREIIKTETLWKSMQSIAGGAVKINNVENTPIGWEKLAARDGVYMLITTDSRMAGNYKIYTFNSDVFKLDKHPSQKFIHNNRFVASYSSFEDAKSHAIEMINNLK